MKTLLIRSTISIVLLGVVVFLLAPRVHPADIRQALSPFSWSILVITFSLSFLISLLKATRFHLMIQRIGLHISFWQSCKVFFTSQAATSFPGGETVRILFLKKETHAHAIRVAGPVVAQAILELIAAVSIVLVGSLIYPSMRWIAAILLLLFVPLLIFMFSATIITSVAGWAMPWKRVRSWFENLVEAQETMSQMMFRRADTFPFFAMTLLGLAFLADALGALLILFLASRLGLPLNFLNALYLYGTSVAIMGLLGVIPGGLGVTEGGMLGLLSLWLLPLEKSISLVAIFRVATLLFPIALGFVFLIVFYGKKSLIFYLRPTNII